ncbi:hypothetical protein D3C76_1229910 [compost metagenome]
MLGAVGEVEHALAGLDRGGGEAGEGFQVVQVAAGETLWVQRVEGQQAPWLLVEK